MLHRHDDGSAEKLWAVSCGLWIACGHRIEKKKEVTAQYAACLLLQSMDLNILLFHPMIAFIFIFLFLFWKPSEVCTKIFRIKEHRQVLKN